MLNDFCIIGLGSFGLSVVETLIINNKRVVVVDKNEKRIDALSISEKRLILDSTDEIALREAELNEFENVIIAIGDSIESSILTTINFLKFETKNIFVKAINPQHAELLTKLGVVNIFQPDMETGRRAAFSVMYGCENFRINSVIDNEHFVFTTIVNNVDITEQSFTDVLELFPILKKINIIFVKNNNGKTKHIAEDFQLKLQDKVWFVAEAEDFLELCNLIEKKVLTF